MSKGRTPVTIRAAFIAGSCAVLAGVITILPNYCSLSPDANLRIVDVRSDDLDSMPSVDVKLRNRGRAPAFVTRVELSVEKAWVFVPLFAPAFVASSWTYDVQLPVNGAPYQKDVVLSQKINGLDVDRFTIRIAPEGHLEGPETVVYFGKLTFVYDESHKRLESQPIFWRTHRVGKIVGAAFIGGPGMDSVLARDVAMAQEMRSIAADHPRWLTSLAEVIERTAAKRASARTRQDTR